MAESPILSMANSKEHPPDGCKPFLRTYLQRDKTVEPVEPGDQVYCMPTLRPRYQRLTQVLQGIAIRFMRSRQNVPGLKIPQFCTSPPYLSHPRGSITPSLVSCYDASKPYPSSARYLKKQRDPPQGEGESRFSSRCTASDIAQDDVIGRRVLGLSPSEVLPR